MATIYDIAKKSGFAPATVSKALNNYSGVNEESKNKILAVAKEMGYQPNSAARALRTSKSYSIGVVLGLDGKVGVNQLLLMNILNSFQDYVEKKGYDIILLTKSKTKHGTYSYYDHINKRHVDGVLVFGNYYKEEIKELLSLSIPVVGFDYIGTKINGVTSDSYDKYFALTEKLIELGHRNIVFFYGKQNIITEERIKGFKDALDKHSIPFDESLLVETGYYDSEANHMATLEVLKRENPPTAILYPDDYSSLGGFSALEQLGLSIPNDVSIAGFDGIEIVRTTYPPLTTVKQDTNAIGLQLAKDLLKQIGGNSEMKSIKVVKSELIITSSISKPKVRV